MSRWEYLHNGKFSRFYKAIKQVAEKENRNALAMYIDFLYCAVRHGSGITDYVNYKLYNVPEKDRKNFIMIIDSDKFYNLLSPSAYKETFSSKPLFLETFKKYITREWCTYEMGFEKFEGFLERNEVFMLKPVDGLGGHDIVKMNRSEIADRKAFFEQLNTERKFVEELIVQHSEMSRIAPASVNTIRVVTYGNNDDSYIVYATLRVGDGIKYLDNAHQNGLQCRVDLATGKCLGPARNKEGKVFDEHPVTHVTIEGFQIPNWDYVKKMCCEAALVNQNIHVVGWDVAVLPEGATFVEGNRRPGWELLQTHEPNGSKYKMDEVLQRYYEDEAKKAQKN